uniref:Serine hydrolase like 2 n=1 Tax=Equus caballus TaxID=9796 RepID=A0A9L0RQM2_HORSE
MGLFSKLKLDVPWGHIAAKAWGSQQGPPVLCLHGWLDNANSFDRLIPLLPKDFHYVAVDFGGHGLSSHYGPGLPYYQQNFVSEVRRVAAALKWDRFSLMGHSFGGLVGGMFSCVFPEMVDKLILLEAAPFAVDSNEMENLLTYKRRAIEHTLLVEASKKPSSVVSWEEMLQRFLQNNSHVSEESGELLLQRGTTPVAGAPHWRGSQTTTPQLTCPSPADIRLPPGSAICTLPGTPAAISQDQGPGMELVGVRPSQVRPSCPPLALRQRTEAQPGAGTTRSSRPLQPFFVAPFLFHK